MYCCRLCWCTAVNSRKGAFMWRGKWEWAGREKLKHNEQAGKGGVQNSEERHTYCPWCCPSHRRELLPVVSPIAPPCAAAHRVTHRAAVRCCSWCCLSRCSALQPWCHPSRGRALLPVMPLVTPVRAAARRTVCLLHRRVLLPVVPPVVPLHAVAVVLPHHALLPVAPPVVLRRAAGARVSLWCEGGQHQVVEPAYRTW